MKFSLASLSILALAPLAVFAQSDESIQEPKVPVQLTKFRVEPSFPQNKGGAIPEFINEKETPVKFTFINNESFPIQVAAFAGSFNYPGKTDPYANLTNSAIADIIVEAGSVKSYDTNIKVSLPPQDFDLGLIFLVKYEGVSAALKTGQFKVSVSDPPVSAWDPKLLFVQLIIGLTVMGAGYLLSHTYLMPYFEEQPKHVKKAEESSHNAGVVPNEKGYDEAWIPQHHLAHAKKTRKTK